MGRPPPSFNPQQWRGKYEAEEQEKLQSSLIEGGRQEWGVGGEGELIQIFFQIKKKEGVRYSKL